MAKKRKKIQEPEEEIIDDDDDDDPIPSRPVEQLNQTLMNPQTPYPPYPQTALNNGYGAQNMPPGSPFGQGQNGFPPPAGNPMQSPFGNNVSQNAPGSPFGGAPGNGAPPPPWGQAPVFAPPNPYQSSPPANIVNPVPSSYSVPQNALVHPEQANMHASSEIIDDDDEDEIEEIEEEEEEVVEEKPKKKKGFFGGGSSKPKAKDKDKKDKGKDKKEKDNKKDAAKSKGKPVSKKSKKESEEPESDEIEIDENNTDPTDGKHVSKKNDPKDPFRPPKMATQTAMAISWAVNAASFRGFMCFMLSICLILLSLAFALFVIVHQDVVYLSLDSENRPTYVTAQVGAVPNHETMVRDFIYNAFIGDVSTMQENIAKASALMTPTASSLFFEKYWKLSMERMRTDNLVQTMVIQSIKTTELTAEGMTIVASCARQWSTKDTRIQTGRVNITFKIINTNTFTAQNPWGMSIDGIEYQGSTVK